MPPGSAGAGGTDYRRGVASAETPLTAPARRGSPEHAASDRFIPHVQGLRAIAVLLVVIYHFWPARLPGGYVGVDVFFVISGFLITGHLMRELDATGRVALAGFWARRARRLLPASLLVLLFCAVVVAIPYLTPISALQRDVSEIIASTFYVENWYLAITSADYLGLTGDPSMVQHYWSLSLEEQFYGLWPLLLLLAGLIAARWAGGRRRAVTVAVVAVVSAASLALSVYLTATDPAPAYFNTFGRMWEFGIGALIALVPRARVRQAGVSFVLGWGGVAALAYAAFRFDGSTPFPGSAALVPVLGSAAVIAAANTERWWYPTRILAIRPARFTGDISYSLYLWHWPLIVIAPFVPFWGLTFAHRVALLVLCFVLAWLTKRFVEDPVRRWPVLTSRRPRVTLWGSLVAMVVVAGVTLAGWAANAPAYRAGAAEIAQVRENPPPCFGAASVLDPGCADQASPAGILPAPGFAGADKPADERCFVQLNQSTPAECTFGSTDPDAPVVALIGDSHAFQLLPTAQRLAEERGWRLEVLVKGACPWNTQPVAADAAFTASCTGWRDAVAARLAAEPPDAVLTAALATTPYTAQGYADTHEAAVAGYRAAWEPMLAAGVPIVTMVDNPVWSADPNICLRTRPASECDAPRADVLVADDPLRDAAAGLPGVTLLDFTDVYCGGERCAPVVGGANVYRDQDHLTVTFADTLGPWLGQAVDAALAARG